MEDEDDNGFWDRVYVAVIITTVIVILALSGFSYYFS